VRGLGLVPPPPPPPVMPSLSTGAMTDSAMTRFFREKLKAWEDRQSASDTALQQHARCGVACVLAAVCILVSLCLLFAHALVCVVCTRIGSWFQGVKHQISSSMAQVTAAGRAGRPSL
jgi:hypothetical protein